MTLDEINRLRALKAKDDGITFDLEVLKVADQLLDAAERAERAEKERDTLRDEVLAWRAFQEEAEKRSWSKAWYVHAERIADTHDKTDAAGILCDHVTLKPGHDHDDPDPYMPVRDSAKGAGT